VEDQQYTNPFVEVRRKAKAVRDRVAEANRIEAELRESRLVRETADILDHEAK